MHLDFSGRTWDTSSYTVHTFFKRWSLSRLSMPLKQRRWALFRDGVVSISCSEGDWSFSLPVAYFWATPSNSIQCCSGSCANPYTSAERKLRVGDQYKSSMDMFYGPSHAQVSKLQYMYIVQYLLPKDFCTSLSPGIVRDSELGGFIRICRCQQKLRAAEFYLPRIKDSKKHSSEMLDNS